MYKFIIAGGATLLIAACASAPTAKPQVATATQQQAVAVTRGTADAGQQLICVDSNPLGSHIPQRICLTKAQMAARKKADQQAMQNLEQHNQGSSCAPSCEL